MTDDLRTRIARVMILHQRRGGTLCVCGWGQLGHSHADHQADAVICELGLRQERQQGPYNHMYRYVTELTSDI